MPQRLRRAHIGRGYHLGLPERPQPHLARERAQVRERRRKLRPVVVGERACADPEAAGLERVAHSLEGRRRVGQAVEKEARHHAIGRRRHGGAIRLEVHLQELQPPSATAAARSDVGRAQFDGAAGDVDSVARLVEEGVEGEARRFGAREHVLRHLRLRSAHLQPCDARVGQPLRQLPREPRLPAARHEHAGGRLRGHQAYHAVPQRAGGRGALCRPIFGEVPPQGPQAIVHAVPVVEPRARAVEQALLVRAEEGSQRHVVLLGGLAQRRAVRLHLAAEGGVAARRSREGELEVDVLAQQPVLPEE
eukprot:5040170-Prymnesium_polylepis.1